MHIRGWLGSAAMVFLAGVPAGVTAQMAPQVPPTIPASGTVLELAVEGQSRRTPDVATIRAGIVAQGASAAAAMAENATRMARMLAALRRAGVADRDIATASITLQPQYRFADNQPPVVTGYQATNSVSVQFRNVARSGAVLDAVVAEGANQIDGPNLSIDDPDAALDEARADAMKRARARADLYARAAGLNVVRIVSIDEAGQDMGGPDHPPVMALARSSASAKTQVIPGEKQVGVTLTVKYLLQ